MPLYLKSNENNNVRKQKAIPSMRIYKAEYAMLAVNGEAGSNIMAKIPVTKEGLKAIEVLVAEKIPINATEVMAVKQALDVCEIYHKLQKV